MPSFKIKLILSMSYASNFVLPMEDFHLYALKTEQTDWIILASMLVEGIIKAIRTQSQLK